MLPSRFVISAGTYAGAVCGWDSAKNPKLQPQNARTLSPTRDLPPTPSSTPLPLAFAISNHEGSVRVVNCAPVPPSNSSSSPPLMFSVGNDNALRLYDLNLYVEIGETRIPSNINGSCSAGSFVSPTHILIGTTDGKLVLFEVKTLQVVHVMGGHSDLISSIAPHPGSSDGSIKPGALALTCSNKDNTIRLWDLTKGRCSYVTKVTPAEGKSSGGGPSTIKFSPDGSNYTYVHSFTHVTTKTTLEGNVLLDIDLESLHMRINDFCYVNLGFVSLGLQNGGIALMKLSEEGEDEDVVKASMVIEGSESGKSTSARIKCMETLVGGSGYLVCSCTSEGVMSVWDMEGAANALMDDDDDDDDDEAEDDNDDVGAAEKKDDSDVSSVESSDDQCVLLQRATLGSSGSNRITSITCWSEEEGINYDLEGDAEEEDEEEEEGEAQVQEVPKKRSSDSSPSAKKAKKGKPTVPVPEPSVMEDAEAVARARKLIEKSKKIKRKSDKKAAKKRQNK